MPRLRDLEATFLERTKRDGLDVNIVLGDLRDERADGIIFLCPKCFIANGGRRGTHSVICWFVGRVPDNLDPKPGRWNPAGQSIDDLTFVGPGSTSVLLLSGCLWHGQVRGGVAE